jgi:diguanylate cyclase (GGDEF)-like protein
MTLPETGPTRVEMRVMNGLDERWLEISGSELPRHSTQAPQAIVQIEDITERRLAELEVRRAAARDPLTGLSNRTELMQRLTQLCVTSRETQTTGAVLFCDLDGFKAINDTFGHPAGDTALIACAARLAALVRGTDRAYRVGGDEFVILLADVSSWTVEEIVGRVKASVAAPLTHDGEHLRLSLSVGWAAIDGRTVDVARILAAADAAMYADKRAHRPAHRS